MAGIAEWFSGFLTESIPLEDPVRIEYDPVLDHVFLATESNLATFDFDPEPTTSYLCARH